MRRDVIAAVVAGMFAALVLTGCGQKEMERLKAENVKIKEENVKLQKELESGLAENAEMKAKLDRIQGILAPPPPENLPAEEPAVSGAQQAEEKAAAPEEKATKREEEPAGKVPPTGGQKKIEDAGHEPHQPEKPK